MSVLSADLRIRDGFSGTFSKALKDTGQISSKLKILSSTTVKPVVGIKDNITGSIGKIKGSLIGLSALVAGGAGLFALTEKAVTAGDNLYRLSTQLHVSASEAGLLNRMLGMSNVEAKPFIATMVRLDKALETAGEKGNATTETLSEFGISLTDNHGLLSYTEQLDRLAQGYKKAVETSREEEFVTNILGARGTELVPLLQDYAETMEAASKVKGIGIDPQKAHEQAIAVKALKMQVGQVGMAMADAFMPIAEQVTPLAMSAFSSLAENIKANSGEIKKAFDNTFTHIRTRYLDNPDFKSMGFSAKIDFIMADITEGFNTWLNNGGRAKVETFGRTIGEGLKFGLLQVAPTIGEALGQAVLSTFTSALKSNPLGAMIMGAIPGAAVGSVVPGVGTAAGAIAGAGSGLMTWGASKLIDQTGQPMNQGGEVSVPEGFGGIKGKGWKGLFGHASGLSYVPYDNYPALLHRGERVMTASDNRQYKRPGPTQIIIQKLADRIDASNYGDIDRLLDKLEERLLQVEGNMGTA